MAKSKLDKLLEAIGAAEIIKSESIIGEEPGQFAQESFDKLAAAIVAANAVVEVKDNEPVVYDEALTILVGAVKDFKESVNPDTGSGDEEQSNGTVPETPILELKEVILKGWVDGNKGMHSIHLKNRIVSFVDGKSVVSSVLAEELQKAGYIE